ncbi:MAG TPA: DnaJ domain-containing protein [Acidimicrobiales bacterium]
MNRNEAAGVLGVKPDADAAEVRRAYHERIRSRHPDHAGAGATADAAQIISAYGVLVAPVSPAPPPPRAAAAPPRSTWGPRPPTRIRSWIEPASIVRVDDDTIAIGAPADEAFLLLMEAAHDIGEVSYVDRSVPILEAICTFEGQPATSLVITLQGRNDGTEAFCTSESIEARPGPHTKDVVDVYEDLLRQRQARRLADDRGRR